MKRAVTIPKSRIPHAGMQQVSKCIPKTCPAPHPNAPITNGAGEISPKRTSTFLMTTFLDRVLDDDIKNPKKSYKLINFK